MASVSCYESPTDHHDLLMAYLRALTPPVTDWIHASREAGRRRVTRKAMSSCRGTDEASQMKLMCSTTTGTHTEHDDLLQTGRVELG